MNKYYAKFIEDLEFIKVLDPYDGQTHFQVWYNDEKLNRFSISDLRLSQATNVYSVITERIFVSWLIYEKVFENNPCKKFDYNTNLIKSKLENLLK